MNQHPRLRATDQPLWIHLYDDLGRPEIIVREIRTLDTNQVLISDTIAGLPDEGDVVLLTATQTLAQVAGFITHGINQNGFHEVDILIRDYPRKHPNPSWALIIAWFNLGCPTNKDAHQRIRPILN